VESHRKKQYRLIKNKLETSWVSGRDGEINTYKKTHQAIDNLVNVASSDPKLLKMIVHEANNRGMAITGQSTNFSSQDPYSNRF